MYNRSSSSSSSSSRSYGGGNNSGSRQQYGNTSASTYDILIDLPTIPSTSIFGKWRYICHAGEGSYCEVLEIDNVGDNKCRILKTQNFMDSEMEQDLGGKRQSYKGTILSDNSIEYEYCIPISAGNYIRMVKHHLILRNGIIEDNCTSYSQHYTDASWTNPTYTNDKSSSRSNYYCIENQ